MQIIQAMADDEYNRHCSAGEELVKRLTQMLRELGLPMSAAPSVVAVASAGIAKVFGIDPQDLARLIDQAGMMWRLQDMGNGNTGIVYDPPYLRPDFEQLAAVGN